MYVACFFLFPGIALALGSFWALIPAALVSVVLVVRTPFEDRTLQNELEGYKEYACRVRYRLIPGIWQQTVKAEHTRAAALLADTLFR
jgi:protein-S-isoprenylcysteine O-methyltransferase Ste14